MPTTTQNGSTKPMKKWDRSVPMPSMAAGRTDLILSVKSMKGISRIWIVCVRKTPDSTGTTTYTSPHRRPMKAPMLNTRQRHPSCFPEVSASAVAPPACTGAMGKGSSSTSLVRRNMTYPRERLLTLTRMITATSRDTGLSQAACRKVRADRPSDPREGTNQSGMYCEMPWACGD